MYLQIKPATKPRDFLCDAFVRPPCRMTKTHFVEGAENRSQDNFRKIAITQVIPGTNGLLASGQLGSWLPNSFRAPKIHLGGVAAAYRQCRYLGIYSVSLERILSNEGTDGQVGQ